MALVIPGIFLSLKFALIDPIVLLEGIEGIEGTNARKRSGALTRSGELIQGKKENIFGTMCLTVLGAIVVSSLIKFILSLPLTFIGQTDNFSITVIGECATQVLTSVIHLVPFVFSWDATHARSTSA